jgi:hypothetical protein
MKNVTRYLLSFFPTSLPQGVEEFNAWASDVIILADVPDNRSTRFAAATMVLHLDPTTDRKPKRYFAKALRKGAANEVVSFVIQDLKAKQLADIEAAKKAAETPAPEVTVPTPAVASDGPKQ